MSIWNGLRKIFISEGFKQLLSLLTISTVKDDFTRSGIMLFTSPAISIADLMTDDDKDNSAQLLKYLATEGDATVARMQEVVRQAKMKYAEESNINLSK
jgi:hypothetical protein